ncbi:hypothetical protein [Paenibacillus taichungensis]|uniref:hypothetical protein n=1 Tax=Paenibacillus taichungensis TaxID=484184 RepID=UPI0039A669EE
MYTQPHPESVATKVYVVNGSDIGSGEGGGGGGTADPEIITILGSGSAANTVNYPASGSVKRSTDITVTYGSSTAATTGTFTTFLVDINDRESVLPGIRNNISIAQVTSANVGDVVDYTIPAGCKLRIKYSAPSGGGTLSIKGVV